MRLSYIYIFIFFSLLWSGFTVSAVNYSFRGINMANGLSDLLVNAIYKDSKGFIWLGTDNCLDRFDGVTIKHYPIEGADLKKKRINVITENQSKELWIGNNTGLWLLSSYTELPERMFSEMIDCPVYSLYADDSGILYIGAEKGLFIYKDNVLKPVLPDNNIFSPSNKIYGIEKDESNCLWLATADGLCRYEIESESLFFYHSPAAPAGGNFFQNITRIENTLYLGTPNQGIFSFDIQSGEFHPFVDVGSKIISALSGDGKENIYVGTDGNGVHFLSHKEKKITRSFLHRIQEDGSIRSNSVYSLLVDREGIIWIGFYQAGFDYSLYQNRLFQTYAMPPFFDSIGLTVRSFYIDDSIKIIGTRDGLYYVNEKTKTVRLLRKPELRANLILSITAYQDEYYIGTYGGGLSILEKKTLTLQDFKGSDEPVFRNGHIFCLKKDAEDVLWIGTSNGVYTYDGKKNQIRHFDHTNSQIPEGNVYDIFFDSTGKGWICTDNGLSIYDPSTRSMRSNIFPENFFHKEKIRLVFEDKDKKLYFLPDRGGLLISDLSMSIFDRYPVHPSLHGNAYTTILQDDEGWIWLGSDDGLIRTKFDEGSYYSFNFTDGISGSIFMYPAYKDEKGILWFSNNKGLLYTDPQQVNSLKQNPYPIVITDILVKGNILANERYKTAQKKDILKLGDKENNVRFRFVNLSYSNPASAIYQYKMAGTDKEWLLLSGENEVNYYDLKPGSYRFMVRIPGNEQSEVSVNLKIGSWFSYGRYWLITLVILFIIGLLIYQLYRSRKTIYNPQSEEKYKTNRLDDEECKILYTKLQEYMKAEKPYIHTDLKIVDLAKAISTPSYSLSYLFNQYLHLSYYDYINQYRIEEFKRIVVDPQYKKYTLTALATSCGFSSRSSFFRSFKKVMGITPSEYIQQLGLHNKD